MAQFLQAKGIIADHFHSALSSERKKEVQERFINGDLKVIAATNAFGMGIDKPDVRLVVHADIPGSLENYLQEAGRAGRDSEAAKCILLYTEEDIERQFGMGARARLNRSEINAVLKALRKIDSRNHRRENKGVQKGEVIATTGEILLEEDDLEFQRDSQTDDTRMRTAVGWLEEATLLERSHNEVNVYPASLMVSSVQQVRERLNAANLQLKYRGQLEKIAHRLIDAAPDTGLSTDELMAQTGMNPAEIRKAMQDLSQLGIVSDDTAITAFVHHGIARDSTQRFHEASGMEESLIRLMQEQAPEQKPGETEALHLRVTHPNAEERGTRQGPASAGTAQPKKRRQRRSGRRPRNREPQAENNKNRNCSSHPATRMARHTGYCRKAPRGGADLRAAPDLQAPPGQSGCRPAGRDHHGTTGSRHKIQPDAGGNAKHQQAVASRPALAP